MALKRNSRKVLDIIAGQKQRNAKQAYLKVHPNAQPETAQSAVSKLLSKTEAQIYLKEHEQEAIVTVVDVMRNAKQQTDNPAFQRLAKDSADSILDRNLGKATQRTENISTAVNLNLDLTTALDQPIELLSE